MNPGWVIIVTGVMAAGFDVVVQDVIIGPALPAFVARIRTPARFLVVLAPDGSATGWTRAGRPRRTPSTRS